MYKVILKNGKSFNCDSNTTIFEAAKQNGIVLEHSCLAARCRSCAVLVKQGSTVDVKEDLILTKEEKLNHWTLACNAKPSSDLLLDFDDLSGILTFEKRIVPAKIADIRIITDRIIKVVLRLPPNANFKYNAGQYVNIIRGSIRRSYSISNSDSTMGLLTFFIKNYENGLMSNYWFKEAGVNDLLRIEGPFGSFVYRESAAENIVFLTNGTGIAPVKAILESLSNADEATPRFTNRKIWLFMGHRYESDVLWAANEVIRNMNLKVVPVLSKGSKNWEGEKGYVQDVALQYNIPLANAQVYACGSGDMIESAKALFVERGLNKNNFFSDAFVETH
jgi:CDP-4-dehydro-6-deoxyglucose reductase, E3